ncbi:putative virion structural protein [Pseudomonas phage OBP]|uniref:internal head protein n=1 Tax=Pseudomonas phage OBP TaxID=1124849 RepID=UPI000240D49E|nr:internal head protein [Pseudomonas phage OBP]AEV89549.1 putative virion structural protein [Pseudomonas phage OBP]
MSFKDLFSGISGTESMDIIPDTQPVVVEQVVYSPEEAALIVNDRDVAINDTVVTQLTNVVDNTATAMEVLTDKVEELQTSIEGMESMRSGKVEFNAGLFAHHYNKAAKISAQFGAKPQHLGAESFTSKDELGQELLDGCEAFKDIAKKAGGKVKEMFIALYNGFLDLFDKYIAGYKNLGQRATTLLSQVTKDAKDMVAADKVKLPAACAFVDDKGQASDIPQQVIALANGLKSIGSTAHPDDVMKAVDFATKGILDLGKKSQMGTDETTDTYKVEFNDVHFTLVVPREVKGLDQLALKDIGTDSKAREVSGMAPNQLISLLKEIESYCKKLEAVDLSRKGLTTIRDNAIARTNAGFEAKNVQNLHAGMLKLCKGVSELSGRSIKGQLAFVQAQISQSTKKKED